MKTSLRAPQMKQKDKAYFDLNVFSKILQKIEPKSHDRLYFELIYFLICVISISVQYFHIYKWVIYNIKC